MSKNRSRGTLAPKDPLRPAKRWADLSRSQVQRIAAALKPVVAEHGTREDAAKALKLASKSPIDMVLKEPVRASLRIEESAFLALAAGLGIDVSGWDVKDTR